MTVEIIVPFGGIDPQRRRILNWLQPRLPYKHVVALDDSRGEWSKGRCLYPRVVKSAADVLVIHDADVWCPDISGAVRAVQDHGYSWARPHGLVHRLTQSYTDAVLSGRRWAVQPSWVERPPYYGMSGGGIVVARREVLLDAPMDPRFEVWGQDDESWAMALWCLHGEPWQGQEPLVHLWHEPAPRLDRRIGSDANWDLRRRYAHARKHPERMREMTREARECLKATYPKGYDHSAVGVGSA